ncbi:MAG: saccharopine dehydrogenase, partial [Chitinophagaceae bacterium]|nr:saccharopine dehydrogenase [Chitinophagaceae bacterium]
LKDNFSLTDIENRLLSFLGFFEDTLIDKGLCSAADVLQIALEKKLTLAATDHDMVIMQHEIGYLIDGIQKKITSTLIVKCEDKMHTALAKTVGLPLGIAAELILQKKIGLTGLHIPVVPEIYTLVLTRLSEEGIHFTESEQDIPMK